MANGTTQAPPQDIDEFMKQQGSAKPPQDIDEFMKQQKSAPTVKPTEENLPGSTPRLREAVKSGVAPMTPPTQFERERTPEGSPLWRGAKAVGQDVLGMATGMAGAFDPTAGARQGAEFVAADQARKEAGYSPGYRAAAGIGSLAGVNAGGMEQAAAHGDTAGIVGHMVTPAALAALGAHKAIAGEAVPETTSVPQMNPPLAEHPALMSDEAIAERRARNQQESTWLKSVTDNRRAAAKTAKAARDAEEARAIPTVPATAVEPAAAAPPAPVEPMTPPAAPQAPPPVATANRIEVPGTMQDPTRLGMRGEGGVVAPQPKLLPFEAPKVEPPAETPPAPAPAGAIGALPQPPRASIEDIVNQATGNVPVKAPPGQPLRPLRGPEVPPPAPAPEPAAAPKPAGSTNPFERLYESEEARKAAHSAEYQKWQSLGRVELRQALIDSGEDMGDKIVSDAKGLGPGAISRREAIQTLTRKGVEPPPVPGPVEVKPMVKPGEVRTTNLGDLKVGDTFIDETGDARKVEAIEGNKIHTKDGDTRIYNDDVEHIGQMNNPKSQGVIGARRQGLQGGAPTAEEVTPMEKPGEAKGEEVKPMVKPGELPPQPRLPNEGTFAAIKTDDGAIYPDLEPNKQRTHVMLAKDLGIPPERIVSGGWLKDGEYEGSERSDAGRYGEQARARINIEERREGRQVLPKEGKPTSEVAPMEKPAEKKGEEVKPMLKPGEAPAEAKTGKATPEEAINALKERVKDQTYKSENPEYPQERDYAIHPKGSLDPNKMSGAVFLLDDGSAISGDKHILSHMQLARELGQDHLNNANAIRVVTPDAFELHGPPSEEQLAEMSRYRRGLARENSQSVHDPQYVYWDFYPKNVTGYSADAVSEFHDSGAGRFPDFQRAVEDYYKPRTVEIAGKEVTKNPDGTVSFNGPLSAHDLEALPQQEPTEVPDSHKHLSLDIYKNLQLDEREFLKDRPALQKNVMKEYDKIEPTIREAMEVTKAGHGLGGWWKRFIDAFDAMGETDAEAEIDNLGPSHAEALKATHSALSGNKSVEHANKLAWNAYRDWLDDGRPRDRESINKIIAQNGKPKGVAAISDTIKNGKVVNEGLDTTKFWKLVNSPQFRENAPEPFHGQAFVGSPAEGVSPGAKKIPSMLATVANKGNLNRVVFDTHMKDMYGQNGLTDAKYIADSVHIRQAAQEMGLKAGEAQEQMWGTVLGLKSLMRGGMSPAEAARAFGSEHLAAIGKDYAQIMLDAMEKDPDFKATLDGLKKYGFDPGGPVAVEKLRGITEQGKARMAEKGPEVNRQILGRTAKRIAGQMASMEKPTTPSMRP